MFQPSATSITPAVAPVSVKHEQASSEMEAHVADGDDTAVWFMERVEDGSTATVRFDEVSRIQPKEKDMVLVISGADVGVEGELVCIDGSDAILKDSNEDFKIVDFVHLAKISGEN
jgi:hypothetical protein